jgi:hypothetical protein
MPTKTAALYKAACYFQLNSVDTQGALGTKDLIFFQGPTFNGRKRDNTVIKMIFGKVAFDLL